MKISIGKPLGYSHIGMKDNQEDTVWPAFQDVGISQRVFLLCDGVGGNDHGEVASKVVSSTIGKFLCARLDINEIVNGSDIQDAVNLSYNELNKVAATSDGKPMATTLTCVVLDKKGIIAAHMGDSRIYLVRPQEGIIYQSEDHSLVNALLNSGELTPEEAKTFPRKNVITKAIQAGSCSKLSAEVRRILDVKSGDYIFMCCDGVLENLTNERLFEILSSQVSNTDMLKMLEAEGLGKTKDNFTAYLIPIVGCKETDEVAPTIKQRTTVSNEKTSFISIKFVIYIVTLTIIILLVVAFLAR